MPAAAMDDKEKHFGLKLERTRGTYALISFLENGKTIRVGKLGAFAFKTPALL